MGHPVAKLVLLIFLSLLIGLIGESGKAHSQKEVPPGQDRLYTCMDDRSFSDRK